MLFTASQTAKELARLTPVSFCTFWESCEQQRRQLQLQGVDGEDSRAAPLTSQQNGERRRADRGPGLAAQKGLQHR